MITSFYDCQFFFNSSAEKWLNLLWSSIIAEQFTKKYLEEMKDNEGLFGVWDFFFAGFSPVTALLHPVYNLVEFQVQACVYTALLKTVKSCHGMAQSIVNYPFQSKVVLISCCAWKAYA